MSLGDSWLRMNPWRQEQRVEHQLDMERSGNHHNSACVSPNGCKTSYYHRKTLRIYVLCLTKLKKHTHTYNRKGISWSPLLLRSIDNHHFISKNIPASLLMTIKYIFKFHLSICIMWYRAIWYDDSYPLTILFHIMLYHLFHSAENWNGKTELRDKKLNCELCFRATL